MIRSVLIAVVLAGLAGGSATAASADRSLAFTRANCGGCHNVTASAAASPNARAPRFRDVARRYPPEQLAEALAEGIMVAHETEMPEFRLAPRDIEDLIAHLRAIRRQR